MLYNYNTNFTHCLDIDECEDEALNICAKPEYCLNTLGGYQCKCPRGYQGNATISHPCVLNTPTKPWLIIVFVTAGN